jgi:hypothetical protein
MSLKKDTDFILKNEGFVKITKLFLGDINKKI